MAIIIDNITYRTTKEQVYKNAEDIASIESSISDIKEDIATLEENISKINTIELNLVSGVYSFNDENYKKLVDEESFINSVISINGKIYHTWSYSITTSKSIKEFRYSCINTNIDDIIITLDYSTNTYTIDTITSDLQDNIEYLENLEGKVQDLESDLSSEVTRAKAEEAEITESITDTKESLENRIDTEETTRTSADTALQSQIDLKQNISTAWNKDNLTITIDSDGVLTITTTD